MSDLLSLLQEFHGERLDMMLRHQAGARHVQQYDVNNTYQYVINRDDVQLSWLEAAIAELGGSIPVRPEPARTVTGRQLEATRQIAEEDSRDAQAFVNRWRGRVDDMSNARHAKMLRLILGEVLEQKRFFDQARAGRTDLLGRRGAAAGPASGDVLPSRWIE
ncbi:MAG TPA: hypothetical protein VM818_18865 [Vicinamibacterales bacterium]|nr:hypothetical protein [Vicinamibacterales bacterium]